MSFKEVKAEELTMNPFTKIGKEWLLITAGNEEKCNTMTASWGAMGVMWGKNAVTVYIRPQRYTKEFVDREDTFTISVLGEEYRKALNYCGRVSGHISHPGADYVTVFSGAPPTDSHGGGESRRNSGSGRHLHC